MPLEHPTQKPVRETTRPLRRTWRWLTEPAPTVQGIENRHQARLLSSLLVMLLPLSMLSILARAVITPAYRLPLLPLSAILVIAIVYGLSRTKYYRLGAALIIIALPLFLLFLIIGADLDPAYYSDLLPFLLLGVLLSSLLFGIRGTVFVGIASIGIVLIMSAIIPEVSFSALLWLLALLVLCSAVMGMGILSRNALEDTRWAAILDSEARYHSLFDDSPIALWEADFSHMKECIDDLQATGVPDIRAYFEEHPEIVEDCIRTLRILNANRTALELFGLGSTKELEQVVHQSVRSNPVEFFLPQMLALAEGQADYELEYTIKTRGGSTLHIIIKRTIASGYEGSWEKVYVVLIDVTERTQAEAALRESETRYRTLVEQSLQSVVIVQDNPLRFSFVNTMMQEVTGYSYEELTSFTPDQIREMIHPADRHAVISRVNKRFTGERVPTSATNRIITKNGDIRWMETFTSLIEYEGEPAMMSVFVDVTERKQTEEALRQSEERYRLLFENSLDAVLITAPDGRILHANPSACRILDRTEEELQQAGRTGTVDTSDPRFKDALAERTRTGKFSGELTFIRKDGSTFPGETSSAIFIGPDGEARTSMIIRDITERKQMEEALRKSEAKYRALVEQSLQCVAIIQDNPLRFSFVNKAMQELHGYSYEEMIGFTPEQVRGLVHPADRQAVDTRVSKRFSGGEAPSRGIHRIVAKGGDTRWMETFSSMIEYNGEPAMISVFVDVTERKQAEEALRQSEARYRAIIESQIDLISRYLPDTTLTYVNDAYCQFYGRTREELIGKSYLSMVAPEFREMARIEAESMVTDPRLITGEYLNYAANGVECWIQWVSQPIADENGKIVELQAVGRDVTQLKRTEEALRESEEGLRAAQENANLGSWEYEIESGQGRWSQQMFRLFYLEPAEEAPSFEEYPKLIHPDDRSQIQEALTNLVEGKESVTSEYRSNPERGPVRTFWPNSKLIRDQEGRPVKFIGTLLDITERRKAEDALQESQQMLATLMSNLPGMAYRCRNNANWTMEFISEGCLALTGYPDSALLGDQQISFNEIIAAEDRERVWQEIQTAVDHDRPFQLTYRIVTADGEERWVWEQGRAVERPGSGDPVLEGFATDITETYLTNAALARERDAMEALGQAAQAIQRAHKPEEIYEYVGSAIRQLGYYVTILRVSDDQQQIMLAHMTAQPEMLSRLEELAHVNMESIRVSLEPDNLYHRVLVKKNAIFLDDSDIVIASALPAIPPASRRQIAKLVGERIIIAPLIVGNTAYGMLLVTGPDLTENDVPAIATFATQTAIALENTQLYQELEHYAEGLETAVEERTAELRRTRDWAEAVVNSVGEALMVVAPDGRIQQVNPAFEQYTGYTSQEVVERTHEHLVHIEAIPVVRLEEMLQAMRAGEGWLGEMPVRRKDGTSYDAAVTVTPLRGPAGEAIAFVGALRDISAQKEVQRMKDAFVSNVSHELRTPITSLKLNMSLMRMNPQGQEVYIDRLERETGRLADLIEDLLRLSRLDQGRIKLDLRAVDLNALAERYVEDRIPLAETRELDLRLGDHPGLPTIQADEGLLGQALSVLITNALHYTPAGGEVVISTLVRQEDEGQWVGISVSDNGPGISQEDKAHLFERFYRGKVGRNSEQPGTGLGLAIAQEIVERHAGRIEVESTGVAGQGTTFSIWLPVSGVEAGRPAR